MFGRVFDDSALSAQRPALITQKKKKKFTSHFTEPYLPKAKSYETHNLSELEQDPCQEASLSLEIMVK